MLSTTSNEEFLNLSTSTSYCYTFLSCNNLKLSSDTSEKIRVFYRRNVNIICASFEGEFVDAIGTDLNDVESLSVPRYCDIVRTAESLEIKQKEKKNNIRIIKSTWHTTNNFGTETIRKDIHGRTLEGVQRDKVSRLSKSNVLPSDMPRKMDPKTA